MQQRCHKHGAAISAQTTRLLASRVIHDPPISSKILQHSYTTTDHHIDVQIWSPNPSTPVLISQNAKLQFLSLVEVARIPLYLAAGPSYIVSTTNEATTRWLTKALLDYEESDIGVASRKPWWTYSGMQSDNGLLLKVETGNEEEHGIQNVVTEILFFAAAARSSPELPIPPASSPAFHAGDLNDGPNQNGKSVKVFALPICSNIIGLVNDSMKVSPPTSQDCPSARQAWSLPYTDDQARITRVAPQKRQSISTLFEDATQKRRKLKRRGGESISQTMAGIDRPPSQLGVGENQAPPQPRRNDLRRKSLSQASSVTPVYGPEPSRPPSRSGLLANGKRPSLHRIESVNILHNSPTLPDAHGSYEQQNRAAMTKVLMAAMRLHGIQQKKRPQSESQPPNQVTSHTTKTNIASEVEDEYKLVYHQTFKAAVFTFRKHLNAHLISQETMRDVVDRLLVMFCTDPMTGEHTPDGGGFPESEVRNGFPSSSLFDKPSSQARSSNIDNGWSTPTLKKR